MITGLSCKLCAGKKSSFRTDEEYRKFYKLPMEVSTSKGLISMGPIASSCPCGCIQSRGQTMHIAQPTVLRGRTAETLVSTEEGIPVCKIIFP